MKDNKTLAYINLYAIMGALEHLTEFDEEAQKLATPEKPVSLGIKVANGPQAVMEIAGGKVKFSKGNAKASCHMNFSTPERFNEMVDGIKPNPPINLSIILNAKFLTNNFTALTKILEKYLRADAEALKDPEFFNHSTDLMFYVICEAIAAIGNNDKLGKLSAKRIPDGTIAMEIKDGPCCCLDCKDGEISVRKQKAENPRSSMVFDSRETARKLFDGEDAMSFVGNSQLFLKGFIPMLDNLNKILARVALYLA